MFPLFVRRVVSLGFAWLGAALPPATAVFAQESKQEHILFQAIRRGDTELLSGALRAGTPPDVRASDGTTPLMAAAGVNWAVAETFDLGNDALLEAVKLAHSLGNDVNAVNSMGLAAIHGAANRGADDVIEYLAANGARLDAPDAQGRSPLAWAAGVFLATHPPVPKPHTIALLERLQRERAAAATAATTTTTPPTRPGGFTDEG